MTAPISAPSTLSHTPANDAQSKAGKAPSPLFAQLLGNFQEDLSARGTELAAEAIEEEIITLEPILVEASDEATEDELSADSIFAAATVPVQSRVEVQPDTRGKGQLAVPAYALDASMHASKAALANVNRSSAQPEVQRASRQQARVDRPDLQLSQEASQAASRLTQFNPQMAVPSSEATAFRHQSTLSARGANVADQKGKGLRTDLRVEAAAAGVTDKSAAAPTLEAKTQIFVETLQDSVALSRKLEQSVVEQGGGRASREVIEPQGQFAAQLQGLVSPHANPVGTQPLMPSYGVATPMTHPGWAQAMSQQVLSFLRTDEKGLQLATLRLDPPELGPLKVSIKISDGVATASFVSANAAVRDAVQQALPQLAQNMNQSGLELGQADVSDHDRPDAGGLADGQGRQNHEDDRSQHVSSTPSTIVNEQGDTIASPQLGRRLTEGLIRAYA